jgi:hypothetical protein
MLLHVLYPSDAAGDANKQADHKDLLNVELAMKTRGAQLPIVLLSTVGLWLIYSFYSFFRMRH